MPKTGRNPAQDIDETPKLKKNNQSYFPLKEPKRWCLACTGAIHFHLNAKLFFLLQISIWTVLLPHSVLLDALGKKKIKKGSLLLSRLQERQHNLKETNKKLLHTPARNRNQEILPQCCLWQKTRCVWNHRSQKTWGKTTNTKPHLPDNIEQIP